MEAQLEFCFARGEYFGDLLVESNVARREFSKTDVRKRRLRNWGGTAHVRAV